MKITCIQINSGADMAANIGKVETLVNDAAAQGAELVALPENVFRMQEPGAKRVLYTKDQHPGIEAAKRMAKANSCWLLVGSVSVLPSLRGSNADEAIQSGLPRSLSLARNDEKTYNRSLLINPLGEITAEYNKIHLFDVNVGDGQTYNESAKIIPGNEALVTDISGIKLGLSICYDVRFPQLYRTLAKAGAQILSVPSAFTQVTGEAHWHALLRARAIENGCFVIAPAQTGTHPGGRKTYGHALIVDPWGKVLADAGTEEGIIIADLDLDMVKRVRTKLPSLEHDREFSLSS